MPTPTNGPIDLSFDVDALREQMTTVYARSLGATGSAYSIQTANIDGVHFDNQNLANKQALLKALRQDLKSAQEHGLIWLNDVQPHLTVIPQGVINFASLFAAEIPGLRKILDGDDTTKDREAMQQLFTGLHDKMQVELQAASTVSESVSALRAQTTQDTNNFSESQGKLKQLEELDEENLQQAKTNLQTLLDAIDVLNQQINEEIIKSGEDFSMAGNVIKIGKKLGDAGKVLGLVIALPFITRGALTVKHLINDIDRRFQVAVQAVQGKMRVRELTEQLLCLHATSRAMSRLDQNLGDLTLDIEGYSSMMTGVQDKLQAIRGRLRDGTPMPDILNAFDLGRASADWEMANIFAERIQKVTPQVELDNVLVAN